MTCPRCQRDNPLDAAFCQECGARLETPCRGCGALNRLGARFCKKCGQSLTPDSGSLRQGERRSSPETYTPKYLAEKILTSKAALEGERKQVTVLFADLKGSMELLADRDPEEARNLLDPVLERMMEAVHRYEGTVNQVMGDGIMALFGAPLAHEDHAVRACYAALRMQESLRRYADQTRRSHGVELQIRLGLNSGEVVVRAIGSDLHMDYTAVGQTTHLAARMEQLAPPGSIRLTAETVRLAEGYVDVRSLGCVPVKGLPDPIEAYELMGAGTARTRLQAAVLRGLTRFVGREEEVEHLRRVLGHARAGRGQVVAIVGEAGVGKSRLVYEFTHSHRVQDWLILDGSCISYGNSTSYLPVIDLLKGYFKIGDWDDHREMHAKVLGRVLGLDRALEPLLPPLLTLLDVPVDDAAWQNLDPAQRRQRTLHAVKGLLLRESQVQPLLVVLEDLHWVDGETQALLDSLVDGIASARLLLLVNYRPVYEHRWAGKAYFSLLRIDSLPPESAEELLQALLGPDRGLAPLTRMLVKRGNPFFLEETVRTLVETGVLAGERGAYRLVKQLGGIQVPPTVQAILAARIDRLPPEEKHLLQAAAVIGEDVPFPLLQAITEEPEEVLHRRLAHLQAAEFLYEARLFPDLEYSFKHGLTCRVTYESLLHERRRFLHARIVGAIEALYRERLTEQVERLAHHAVRGEVWDKAVRYLSQAGTKAFARSAHREAAPCFEQALAALTHLPGSRETLEESVDLRLGLRNSLFPLGDVETGLRHLHEAERAATALGDQRRLGWISAYVSEHSRLTGHAADAVASALEARSIAQELGDVGLGVAATYYLGTAYLTAGEYRLAEEFLEQTVRPLGGDLSRERFGLAGFPPVMARVFRTWALAERGAFDEATSRGAEAVRIAEALNHPYSLAFACGALGHHHGLKGDFGDAAPPLERGVALCREWNLHFVAPILMEMLGYAYVFSGRRQEGLELLQQALTAGESIGFAMFLTALLVHLGEARLFVGQPAEATDLAERALTMARQHGQRGHEAWALRFLGDIAAHGDPSGAGLAEAHYRESIALAVELGMRPLVAHCHGGLANVAGRRGRHVEAKEHWQTASTMYREMGMTYWLTKLEAEMKAPA